ncbi:MAG: PIN domain-containing protein [Acidimicrobiales bacterium]
MLLDSTVLIDALRGRPAVRRIREMRRTGDEPWVCAISVEEICRGIRDEEEQLARRLFRGLRVAPVGDSEGEVAGTWRRTFAQRGITLHQADCLIAAAAGAIGADLATGNPGDFPMLGSRVQHWAVGS